ALRGVVGQILGRDVGLAGPPALSLGPGGEGRPAGDRLDAPSAPAHARRPVWVDHHVANMAGVAGRAVDQLAIEYQPAAYSGRHHDAEHRGAAPARPPPVLADRKADRVVMQPHREPPEPLSEPVAQRE